MINIQIHHDEMIIKQAGEDMNVSCKLFGNRIAPNSYVFDADDVLSCVQFIRNHSREEL